MIMNMFMTCLKILKTIYMIQSVKPHRLLITHTVEPAAAVAKPVNQAAVILNQTVAVVQVPVLQVVLPLPLLQVVLPQAVLQVHHQAAPQVLHPQVALPQAALQVVLQAVHLQAAAAVALIPQKAVTVIQSQSPAVPVAFQVKMTHFHIQCQKVMTILMTTLTKMTVLIAQTMILTWMQKDFKL